MAEQMEIVLKTEQKPEAVIVLQFLEEMNPNERERFLVFIQGVKYAMDMEKKRSVT